MIVIKQMKYVMKQLSNNGMNWEEIADVFGHTAQWAWDWAHRPKEKLIIDEGIVAGLHKMGYDIRIVKTKDGVKNG